MVAGTRRQGVPCSLSWDVHFANLTFCAVLPVAANDHRHASPVDFGITDEC